MTSRLGNCAGGVTALSTSDFGGVTTNTSSFGNDLGGAAALTNNVQKDWSRDHIDE